MSVRGRLGDFAAWIDERTGLRALVAHALDEPIRGGARWAYVFGSALLSMFLVQVATGVALMTSYAPGETTAWASVHYIQFRQAGGWLVRGMHHHGAQLMVIGLAVHALQVASFGAYKKPRELTWWLGLVLLALVLGFALTGYLLPWDQKGYWATKVATNIAGTIPVVGPAQQRLLQGGPDYGSLTLTRFYALHVFVLPALVALVVTAHVALFRRNGATPPARADLTRTEAFFPGQLTRDVAASLVVLAIVVGRAWITHGAPLDAPADPATEYPARPEWYFLGLFQLLKYFHGPLEIVGAVVVPALAALYLFALPLIDRAKGTALRPRLPVLAPLVGLGLGVLALSALALRADAADEDFQKARRAADVRAEVASRVAMEGVPPEGPLRMLRAVPEARGPELFDAHCASCHTLGEHGSEKDRTAPRLDGWGTRAWIEALLRDPDADTHFGRTSYVGEMPSMTTKPKDAPEGWKPMAEEDVRAVAAFLESLGSSEGPAPSADLARGREIVASRCTTCHLFEGGGDEGGSGLAPNLTAYGSQRWVEAQIANPSSEETYRAAALDPDRREPMPRFDSELTAADIRLLATWVRAEARARAALKSP